MTGIIITGMICGTVLGIFIIGAIVSCKKK